MDRFPKTVLLSVLLILMSLIGASKAQDCSTYTFTNRSRAFTNCNSLPVLNSFIHWNYHQSNRTIDIAYRHTQITSSNWVAWALNPNATGMVGAQALVAFVGADGSVRAYTSPITTSTPTLQEAALSFEVPSISAEFVGNNQIIIYATIELPPGGTTFNQVWQHGDLSSGGAPQRHDMTGDHMRSSGTIDFASGEQPPEASTPPPPSTTPTTNNCPAFTFSNGMAYSECSSLPVLNAFLHWNYRQGNNSVDIAYRHTGVSRTNWVAWALNPTGSGMIGAQSLVAFVGSNGSIRAYTSPVTSFGTSLQPGQLSFGVPSISAEFVGDNQIIIYATIELPAGGQSFSQVWQHGEVSGDTPQQHPLATENRGSVGTINFATGATTAGGAAGGSTQRKRNVHGVLNVVSWGILMPLGAMAARYLKVFKSANPAWFYLHVTCQASAYIVGVAGWGTGMKLGSDSVGVKQTTHRNIGIALFALGTLQVFALLLRPKPEHKYRVYWNVYHHAVGYAVISMSIANIFEGFDILDPEKKWKNAYIGVIISLGVAAALLEAFTWFVVIKRKRESNKHPQTQTNGYHA